MPYKTFSNIICNVLIFLAICFIIFVCFYSGDRYVFADTSASPIYKGNESSRGVALMFNVYQGSEYIPSILDTLDEYGFKATFFVGGCWAAANEPLMREILSRGHEIGNHGFYHKDMAHLSEEKNVDEIKNCNDLILALTGYEITLFAPPSGSFSEKTLSAAKSLGMTTIMWTKDTIDWRDKDKNVIYKRATSGLSAGDLILMHPTKATAEALDDICKEIIFKKLAALTVSEVIG